MDFRSRGRLYLSVTYSPLRSGSGEVEAALVIQRDLTQYMRPPKPCAPRRPNSRTPIASPPWGSSRPQLPMK